MRWMSMLKKRQSQSTHQLRLRQQCKTAPPCLMDMMHHRPMRHTAAKPTHRVKTLLASAAVLHLLRIWIRCGKRESVLDDKSSRRLGPPCHPHRPQSLSLLPTPRPRHPAQHLSRLPIHSTVQLRPPLFPRCLTEQQLEHKLAQLPAWENQPDHPLRHRLPQLQSQHPLRAQRLSSNRNKLSNPQVASLCSQR